jgi:hypothetical protein
MPARGTPANIALGVGYIYIADLGTTEPTDLATAWSAVSSNWSLIGYTDAGSEFHYTINTDVVDVAEELDPLQIVSTGRSANVQFAMSEITATNLKRALNAPSSTITAGTGVVFFEPPDLGTEVRRMIGYESEDHTERWIFRQCFQGGDIAMQRRKGAANVTITTQYNLEKPTSGLRLFRAILASPGRS